jgi:cytochrome c oxidase assembly factor CtaG
MPAMARSLPRILPVLAAAWAWSVALPAGVSAHGPAPAEPPTVATLLLGWTWEPLPTLGIVAALAWWRWAVRKVAREHPANPVPRRRTVAFVAGVGAIALALLSGIDRYDTTLFWVHMVQHILLVLVAAPLIALSAPVTLLLRVASPATRRRWILPVLHARVTRVLAFPVVAWLVFAGVMWASHFSPLFDAALEDPLVHDLEHLLFLTAGLLFWWPAVAADPAPWRMSHPVRAMYIALQMPQNTFLAVVLLNVPTVLYAHYETLVRPWGPSPLEDQRLAAGLMWIVGDTVFIGALAVLLYAWMAAEARDTTRADRRADAELAEIRVREARLADRRRMPTSPPDEPAEAAQPGTGASR